MDPASIRREIVEVGRRLYARGLIGGNEGNVSVRDGDVLYLTPAGVCKGYLSPEAIVRTDLDGRPLDGGRASTETQMHVVIYRRRPDVAAVVHAHPPTATGFAAAGIPLDKPLIAEAVLTLGPVPILAYGMPSTRELADRVSEAVCGAQAVLLANHGALAVGETVFRAWERMETIEQLARVTLTARLLGGDRPLPEPDVRRLEAARAASGYPDPVCDTCGAPVRLGGDLVVLTREELVRLVAEAVERLART